jgi:hypothetical protein
MLEGGDIHEPPTGRHKALNVARMGGGIAAGCSRPDWPPKDLNLAFWTSLPDREVRCLFFSLSHPLHSYGILG